jgi:bacillolysin
VNTAGTEEFNALFAEIVVYPNPTREWLKIDGIPAGASVYLIDMKGAVVRTVQSESETTEMNVSDVARGSYQLVVRVGSAFVVRSVVLE